MLSPLKPSIQSIPSSIISCMVKLAHQMSQSCMHSWWI
jgi:hypothetical protein